MLASFKSTGTRLHQSRESAVLTSKKLRGRGRERMKDGERRREGFGGPSAFLASVAGQPIDIPCARPRRMASSCSCVRRGRKVGGNASWEGGSSVTEPCSVDNIQWQASVSPFRQANSTPATRGTRLLFVVLFARQKRPKTSISTKKRRRATNCLKLTATGGPGIPCPTPYLRLSETFQQQKHQQQGNVR